MISLAIGQTATITAEHAMCAASVATLQMLRKHSRERNCDHGARSTRGQRIRWADTMHGLMGEIACSEMSNLAWTPGSLHVSTGDVGKKIEVRTTEHHDGHLHIYENDADDGIFVLMTGDYPTFRFAGCLMKGRDGKRPEWWRSNGNLPCWWVPQSALGPLELGD